MTVNELHKLTTKWIKEGHGDKTIYQWYDCNYACTRIEGKVKIKEDCIEFLEFGYPDRDGGEE